ncbi:MAG: 4Fe-4S dicluster domain-containing protein [Nitrospirota bacterium]|nr:4Fe-4S dicluster domain-containing protein [Nitrospirota bacterium]
MTGVHGFREFNVLISKDVFFSCIDTLRPEYKVFGPVRDGNQTVFKEISSSADLFMDYSTTMLSPGKMFIYKPKEDMLKFRDDGTLSVAEVMTGVEKQVIVGIHPCDISAIFYLDRTFLGEFVDPFYKARRENTILIALNCMQVSENCFCSSVGTGPHLHIQSGYDVLLTDLGEDYLAEIKSEKGFEVFRVKGQETGPNEWSLKSEKEKSLLKSFKKIIDTRGLDELLMKNLDHPVWATTADERCLSCSNCVMVCPTCFCYNIVDEMSMDLKEITRFRQLDACQDLRFAEVHGGNFRSTRASRLRQFVIHNLNYTSQYGVTKTVGCGRCITWCPTNIDLTEMAKEVQRSRTY